MGTVTTVDVFKKNKSVFKDWKENTEKTLAACVEHDMKLWKIPNMPRFIKEPEEYADVVKLMEQYIEVLMIVHIYYASEGAFPHASTPNMT